MVPLCPEDVDSPKASRSGAGHRASLSEDNLAAFSMDRRVSQGNTHTALMISEV